MTAELVPITNVIPNPANPRVLKDERFATLVKSIKDFPDMLNKRPLVVVKSGRKLMVLGGNARLKACAELGMQEVPIIRADDWSEEQRKQFIIKDNASIGDWDWTLLKNEWNQDELEDWGLPVVPSIDDFNADEFFKEREPQTIDDVRRPIVLNYTADEYERVVQRFAEIGGSREQIIFTLLGLQ